jgi:hypothetical protein
MVILTFVAKLFPGLCNFSILCSTSDKHKDIFNRSSCGMSHINLYRLHTLKRKEEM